MAEASEIKSEFKVVLKGVRSGSLRAVAEELTNLFPLDMPNALNVAKNAPIILLDKLTPQQARSVGTYATGRKALGADVHITGQSVGKLQVLRWPLLPDIAKRPADHVICPNCGAWLQLQVRPGATPAAEAAQPAESAALPAETEAQPRPAPPKPEAAEEVVLEPMEEEQQPAELSEEEVVLEEGRPQRKRAEPAPAPPPGRGIGGEGSCRVTLVGKIKGEKKRSAAELMAHYLGVNQQEATSELNKKSVVTVARGLTEEQAEECKNQFAGIGVKVNIKG